MGVMEDVEWTWEGREKEIQQTVRGCGRDCLTYIFPFLFLESIGRHVSYPV